jgi:hypothetical protein
LGTELNKKKTSQRKPDGKPVPYFRIFQTLLPPENMNCFLSCNIKSRDQKKYEELAGQIINERGKELGRATLAVNTGDKVVFFLFFSYV